MAQTKKDFEMRERIIYWFKELKRLKMSDKDICYSVAGKLGCSERAVKSHFNGWMAQKKLKSFTKTTMKQKIKKILEND